MQDIEDTIEGFLFEDKDVAGQAKKELIYIEKMQEKVVTLTPADLKDFYEKLIEKDVFSTQVGYTYLYEMRSTLVEQYHVPEDTLSCIPIPKAKTPPDVRKVSPSRASLEEQILSLKRIRTLLSVAVAIFMIVIIGFFVILATNENIGYINTENKILDKYSGWQEQLDAREQELDEREQELDEREEALTDEENSQEE